MKENKIVFIDNYRKKKRKFPVLESNIEKIERLIEELEIRSKEILKMVIEQKQRQKKFFEVKNLLRKLNNKEDGGKSFPAIYFYF